MSVYEPVCNLLCGGVLCVNVSRRISKWVHACVSQPVCVCVNIKECIPAFAKCLRERHLQKASGKESQNNRG